MKKFSRVSFGSFHLKRIEPAAFKDRQHKGAPSSGFPSFTNGKDTAKAAPSLSAARGFDFKTEKLKTEALIFVNFQRIQAL